MKREDQPVNGVLPSRFRLPVVATDVGDVDASVLKAGGEVASGTETRHFDPSTERRVAVDFDVRRSLAYHKEFAVERRHSPDWTTVRHGVQQREARVTRLAVANRRYASGTLEFCVTSTTATTIIITLEALRDALYKSTTTIDSTTTTLFSSWFNDYTLTRHNSAKHGTEKSKNAQWNVASKTTRIDMNGEIERMEPVAASISLQLRCS